MGLQDLRVCARPRPLHKTCRFSGFPNKVYELPDIYAVLRCFVVAALVAAFPTIVFQLWRYRSCGVFISFSEFAIKVTT